MIKKGLKLFYFYINCANEVIYALAYTMETNKKNFEKEVYIFIINVFLLFIIPIAFLFLFNKRYFIQLNQRKIF